MNTWQVKNVKTFQGMEGGGFNCTLYRDGKKQAVVVDDATGGPFWFDWVAKEAERSFKSYCQSLPKWGKEYGHEEDDLDVTPDIAVSELIERYEEEKRLRRRCKTKILLRRAVDPGLAEGEWRTLNRPFTKEQVALIRKHYGEDVVICNFRFGDPA